MRIAGTRAVVIGGSVAGLVAARALSPHFREIVVVERDDVATGPAARRGVPQGRHAHGLLAGGARALEGLFPGICDELVARGAVPGDVARDVRWFLEGDCLRRATSGLNALMMSRPLLEDAVRARTLGLPNVRALHACAVSELVADAGGARIGGVRLGGEVLSAELVVDAAGRGSRTPQWLGALGYETPREERVEIGLTYTTRIFRREPGHLNGALAFVIPPTPTLKRGAVMLAQEDSRWIVTLVSHFEAGAPASLSDFVAYAQSIASPEIYDVVRTAEPVGEAALFRFPTSVWRRYDQLRRFPEGYVVFGDGISSFNPRYGQGMSVAALQAVELDRVLAGGTGRVGLRFFKRAARVVATPWTTAATNDLRIPDVRGRRTAATSFLNWYVTQLQRAAHRDAHVAVAFHTVSNLLASPRSLLRPSMVLRIALQRMLPGWRGRRVPAPSHGSSPRSSSWRRWWSPASGLDRTA